MRSPPAWDRLCCLGLLSALSGSGGNAWRGSEQTRSSRSGPPGSLSSRRRSQAIAVRPCRCPNCFGHRLPPRGAILREGINVRGLNTAATLWCSAMFGTFAGAGQLVASALAATFVVFTNLFLRPIVQLINKQPLGAVEVETHYAVEVRCHGREEAHIRALLLQAASNAGLGLRRLTSENLEDSPQVTVSALLVSASRHDAALEQIIGRMSLEPFVTAVHWQVEQAAAES
jgi:hypothetical protein